MNSIFDQILIFFPSLNSNGVSPGKDVIDQSGDEVSSDEQMDLEDQADQAHSIRVPLVQRPETSFRWCFEFLSCHVNSLT